MSSVHSFHISPQLLITLTRLLRHSEGILHCHCNHWSKDPAATHMHTHMHTFFFFLTSMKSVISSNKTFPLTQRNTHTRTQKKKREREGVSDCRGCSRKRLCPPDVTSDGKVPSYPLEPHILLWERIKRLAHPLFHSRSSLLFLRSAAVLWQRKTADWDILSAPAARAENEFAALYYPTFRHDVSRRTRYTLTKCSLIQSDNQRTLLIKHIITTCVLSLKLRVCFIICTNCKHITSQTQEIPCNCIESTDISDLLSPDNGLMNPTVSFAKSSKANLGSPSQTHLAVPGDPIYEKYKQKQQQGTTWDEPKSNLFWLPSVTGRIGWEHSSDPHNDPARVMCKSTYPLPGRNTLREIVRSSDMWGKSDCYSFVSKGASWGLIRMPFWAPSFGSCPGHVQLVGDPWVDQEHAGEIIYLRIRQELENIVGEKDIWNRLLYLMPIPGLFASKDCTCRTSTCRSLVVRVN